jgi:hypothetical protein
MRYTSSHRIVGLESPPHTTIQIQVTLLQVKKAKNWLRVCFHGEISSVRGIHSGEITDRFVQCKKLGRKFLDQIYVYRP